MREAFRDFAFGLGDIVEHRAAEHTVRTGAAEVRYRGVVLARSLNEEADGIFTHSYEVETPTLQGSLIPELCLRLVKRAADDDPNT